MSAREGLSRYLPAETDKDKPAKFSEGSSLSRYLLEANKADAEALRIIEVTALARIADSLRDMNENTGTRY